MTFPASLTLFCRVVDNYGDIGICWRLARQLRTEYAIDVTLWVDDLASFRRLCPQASLTDDQQLVDGVTVRHWFDQSGQFSAHDVADVVIEFFACDLPPGYIDAMAQCTPRPVWLNLEGLTAEDWVEGCHRLPSMHPRLPLTKHFFFPGFTERTGGLLCERGLEDQRRAFQGDPTAMGAFLDQLGVSAQEQQGQLVSLFCYPHAPVEALFAAWRDADTPHTCLVPEGVASAAVSAFLGAAAVPGAARRDGALTVRVLPFVAQPDYDRLLWACALNFVRGEDSFVRAQWAGRPFVWHIYPQDENLHHTKLRAFLTRYDAPKALARFALDWNGAGQGAIGVHWPALASALPSLAEHAERWAVQMRHNGDLAGNLLQFARSLPR